MRHGHEVRASFHELKGFPLGELGERAFMNTPMPELVQRLRVAERVLACQEHDPAHLALIRKVIARDLPPLTYGGKR